MCIRNWEKNLISWVESHLFLLLFWLVTLLGFVVRVSLRKVVSNDAAIYLLPWYDTIKANGGILSLSTQVGDYNLLYQFLIAVMTYLPIPTLYSYKILSCIFDYLLAIAAACVTKALTPPHENNKIPAFITYALVILSPLVCLNSAAWAQCDSIYAFFAICSFYFLCKERYHLSFLCLGFSFAFKLQAIFLVPFFLVVWFVKRNFSVLNFLWIPVVMVFTALPAILVGRSPMDILQIYINQTSTYQSMYMTTPSFLTLFTPETVSNYDAYRNLAIVIALAVLLAWAVFFVCRKVPCTSRNMLYLLFILFYSCVFFLPAMHDRYGYIYEIAAIIIAVIDKRSRMLLVGLLVVTLTAYGKYLFGYSFVPLGVMGMINLCIYVLYSQHIIWVFQAPCESE